MRLACLLVYSDKGTVLGSWHQGPSAAPRPPSAPLYFAANGERPAGASEGLTVWGPLLQADPTTEVAGSFKIEAPGAVCKMKRCLSEAEGMGRNAGDLVEGSPCLSQASTDSQQLGSKSECPHSFRHKA